MADTDILLTVGLDTTDADKTAEQLQNEIDKIFNSRKGVQSSALTSLEKQMKQSYEKATQLREKLKSIGDAQIATESFQKLQDAMSKYDQKYSSLVEKMTKFEEAGGSVTSQKYQQWTVELQRIEEAYGRISDRAAKMQADGTAYISGKETEEYKKTQQELDATNDKLKQHIIRYRELEDKGSNALTRIHSSLDSIKKGFTRIGALAKKTFSTISGGAKSSRRSMASSLKTILGYAIGIRSIYTLFSKLRSVMQEGFTNLYKQNSKFKSSVDDLKDSLTAMKNSFAAAFQPIVSMAIPYIQKLVDWVTQLMNQIAKFTAAAVGQKYYMKAIKKTGEAAEKANKQLSGFDKLNNLSSDGGGGSGKFEEVPIDEEKIDLLEKLKEAVAQLEGVGAKFGTAIRDALNSIPWDKIQETVNLVAFGMGNFINGLTSVEGLGASIGTNLADLQNTYIGFFQTLLDTIHFDAIGNLLGEALQSWVDEFNWEGYGQLIATGLNSVFEVINGFQKNFEGLSLGTSIGDMINEFLGDINWDTINEAVIGIADDLVGILNGFIEETDWSLVGETLSQGISQLLDFAIEFVTNFDAEGVGTAIIDFLTGIDWLRIAAELGLLLLGLIEKAIELLFGLVEGIADNMADVFDYLGLEGVAGFFRGISENLKTSVKWLKDTFNKYIVQPIKDFFGIHSPSTLFADFGKMIIQGLINGIKNMIGKVTSVLTTLKTKFTQTFTNIKTSVVNIVKALWEAVKKPINSIIGGFEFLVNKVIDALNSMISAINKLSFSIPDWVPELGGKTFGFNIPSIGSVSVPRLAQGAVIPPNKEFMAVLGDQKSGTNIETPLDTMKQAFIEAMQSAGISGNQEIVLQLDGREFMRAMVKQNNQYKKQTGGVSAFA